MIQHFSIFKVYFNYFNVLEKKNRKIIHKNMYIGTHIFPFDSVSHIVHHSTNGSINA